MKKFSLIFGLLCFIVLCASPTESVAQKDLIDDLKSIDSNIVKYFPRWRVCEMDLQIQVYQLFLLYGYPKDSLDMHQIMITAAPKAEPFDPYTLLLLECGSQSMVSSEIDAYMEKLASVLNGETIYSGPDRGLLSDNGELSYCFEEIPKDVPPTEEQARQIRSFFNPTDVTHAFSLSVFEQSMKIGDSGFWIRSKLGTDELGYHFWSAGEAKVVLQRPLYKNLDPKTRKAIPYLIDAHLGGGYRLNSGLDGDDSIFDFVPVRALNASPGGKLVLGLDFHLPIHPQAGIGVNLELPAEKLKDERVDVDTYAQYTDVRLPFIRPFPRTHENAEVIAIAPLLRTTGQVTLFYNWWVNPAKAENFFRVDLGVNYFEVREGVLFTENDETFLAVDNFTGLGTFKPKEPGDWVYAKLEYRNQSSFPFGMSVQYSSQVLFANAYVPILGRWLYLEGKYSTPLRTARPYETKNFFMLSPILRLTI